MKNSKINFGAKPGKNIFEKTAKTAKIQYSSEVPNIEKDAQEELTELQIQFRQKAKAEKELQDKNTNSDFWSCVIFKTQDERDQFLKLLGITAEDNQYINGSKLIKALELKMEEIQVKTPGRFRCNKDIFDLSLTPAF